MNTIDWLSAEENFNIYKIFDKVSKIEDREVIFLCVGNGKIWFDSFGPMMGSLLARLNLDKFIYGNLKASITSSNLREYIEMINKFHINPYIVVFDSALSSSSIGLSVREGATLCSFLSSEATEAGDLSVTFNLTKEFIKSPSNISQMTKEVKRVARYILYCFRRQARLKSAINK